MEKIDRKILDEALAVINDKSSLPSKVHLEVVNSIVSDFINIVNQIKTSETLTKEFPITKSFNGKGETTYKLGEEPENLLSILFIRKYGYFVDKNVLNEIFENYDI